MNLNTFLSLMFIPVRFFGLISSLVNIIIFWHRRGGFKDNIFRLLLIHSISEFIYYVVTSFLLIAYCQYCSEIVKNSYFVEFIIIYFDRYLSSSLVLLSLLIEIAITIYRYLVVISYKTNHYNKDYSLLITAILASVSFSIFIPELITYRIVKTPINSTTIDYGRELTQFGKENKVFYSHYRVLVNILKGPICLSILTVFNLLTLFKFRKQMNYKKKIVMNLNDKRLQIDHGNSLFL
jgi:hypothetical protein